MKKYSKIIIVFCAGIWLDITNDDVIGDAEKLIEYVNSHNMTVRNEDAFERKNELWYLKDQKNENTKY